MKFKAFNALLILIVINDCVIVINVFTIENFEEIKTFKTHLLNVFFICS